MKVGAVEFLNLALSTFFFGRKDLRLGTWMVFFRIASWDCYLNVQSHGLSCTAGSPVVPAP